MLAAAVIAVVLPLMTPLRTDAASPWWQLVGLRGVRVEAVTAEADTILVQTPSGVLRSTDGGDMFQPVLTSTSLSPPRVVSSAGATWTIVDGRVLHGVKGGRLTVDGGSPQLGDGAHLLAAPALYPGVVVAVAGDGSVWRRGQRGGWARCLLLLPGGLTGGVPAVTSLAAFTSPLTGAVYLGTDGYSVLLSTDGGDDWIRAGPGLPDSVLSLAADSQLKTLFAGTSDGLYAHRLQSFPAPPVYQDAALLWRWIGILAVSAAAAAAAAAAILAGVRRQP